MFNQKTGQGENHLIFWDYHVVLLQAGKIHDFNSSLDFSTPLKRYLESSFADDRQLKKAMIPKFRVIPAVEFVDSFLSDRSHMKSDSGWHASPPDWPPISETCSNLHKFNNMTDTEFGEVMSQTKLLSKFTKS